MKNIWFLIFHPDDPNFKIRFISHLTSSIYNIGRGRAFGSKSILLTHEDWIHRKESINLVREQLMKDGIAHIKKQPESWFLNKIQARMKATKDEKDIEKILQDKKRLALRNKQ